MRYKILLLTILLLLLSIFIKYLEKYNFPLEIIVQDYSVSISFIPFILLLVISILTTNLLVKLVVCILSFPHKIIKNNNHKKTEQHIKDLFIAGNSYLLGDINQSKKILQNMSDAKEKLIYNEAKEYYKELLDKINKDQYNSNNC